MTAIRTITLQCDGLDDKSCPHAAEIETGYETEYMARDWAHEEYDWQSEGDDIDICDLCAARAAAPAAADAGQA